MGDRQRGDGPRPYHPTIIRYVGPDGRRCKKEDAGAVAKKTRSKTYYADLEIGGRRVPVSLKTRDEGRAWSKLQQLQRERKEREAGILDRTTEEAARPLAEQVEDWCNVLLESGSEAKQVGMMKSRVLKLAVVAGWKKLGDITADSCRVALGRLGRTSADSRARKGLSPQTRNHYLSHARQLCLWAHRGGRMRSHPLSTVKPVCVEADLRHARRAPTDEEVKTLFAYLASGKAPALRGLSGEARALLYRTAMGTGLRMRELRLLVPASVSLKERTITVRAAYSKNGRLAVQPIPDWLFPELEAWLAADRPLWGCLPEDNPGRVLKSDLRRAGIPRVLDGLYLDMHSFRHWYVTALASDPDVDLKTLMSLARHSTPTLTLKVYAKLRKENVDRAIGGLAEPGTGSAGAEVRSVSKDTAPKKKPESAP